MKRPPRSQSAEGATEPVSKSGNVPAIVESPEAKEKTQAAEVSRLRAEITELRTTLSKKTAELRALAGEKSDGLSDTVRKVLELLEREEGATKVQLVEATGAKEAYVAALLNRILPNKGYSITSTVLQGAKVKTYRLPQKATG